MRTFFIWVTGILTSMIVLGLVGDFLGPYSFGGFWAAVAGALGFTCFRLWAKAACIVRSGGRYDRLARIHGMSF